MKNHPFSLEGERAFITGGKGGLGFAMAQSLLSCGAEVVVCGTDEPGLIKAQKTLGPGAEYVVFDVRDYDESKAIIEELTKKYDDFSIVINNAGNHCKKPIETTTLDDFQDVFDVQIKGAMAITSAFLPHLRKQKKGSIIFVGSMASYLGIPYVTAYAAVKSALLGITRTMAVELGSDNIRVNAVVPGFIDTRMMRNAIKGDAERERKILSRTSLGKFGDPEDIGWAAAYLSSPAAKFVTGQALVVDGGVVIGF